MTYEELFDQLFTSAVRNRPVPDRDGPWYDESSAEVADREVEETLIGYDNGVPVMVGSESKCECGADKCKLPYHSHWCPKFKNGDSL